MLEGEEFGEIDRVTERWSGGINFLMAILGKDFVGQNKLICNNIFMMTTFYWAHCYIAIPISINEFAFSEFIEKSKKKNKTYDVIGFYLPSPLRNFHLKPS